MEVEEVIVEKRVFRWKGFVLKKGILGFFCLGIDQVVDSDMKRGESYEKVSVGDDDVCGVCGKRM